MSLSSLTKELYNQFSRQAFISEKKIFFRKKNNHSHNIAGSNFRSLSNIPHCWPKIAWTLSQFQCGCTSSKTN